MDVGTTDPVTDPGGGRAARRGGREDFKMPTIFATKTTNPTRAAPPSAELEAKPNRELDPFATLKASP